MKKILAGIISYNGRKFLPDCINSCRLSNFDIIVVDNHSKDDSLEFLSSLSNIILKKNNSNLGFTKAANQALEYAIKYNFDYLLLLNQDTEFNSEMVPLLLKNFEENSSLAIVSPIQLNELGQLEYQFNLNCKNAGIDFSSSQTSIIEVPFVNAACWLIDLSKVKQIGFLYSVFNNYGSDLNYCNRAIYCGFKVAINTKTNIIHKKRYRDYQKSLLKTIKIHNTYYLALILNPQENLSIKKILVSLAKGILAYLIKPNLKKALLNMITFFYVLLQLSEIKKIKSINLKS